MARPALACGLVRLHIYGPDATTSRGYLSGLNATGTYSKAWTDSSLSFDAQGLEAAMIADTAMLDDAFAVVELDVGGVWTPITTPYLLAPGEGTVIGPAEGSAKEFRPVAVSALKGLLDELAVLPAECDPDSPTLRYATGGLDGNRYLGWQSKGFTPSGWSSADVYTPAAGTKRYRRPKRFHDTTAEWIWRDSDEGGLTLFRIGEFTLDERTIVRIEAAADEDYKVFLDGPNMGGVVIDQSGSENWDAIGEWQKPLEPGTYLLSAEMTSVSTPGGDGVDALKVSAYQRDGYGQVIQVYANTTSSTDCWRQSKGDPRPGFQLGEVMLRLLQENSDQGLTGADILLSGATFGNTTDSTSTGWDDGQEWVWPILETSLSTAFADFSEDLDLDLTASFDFNAYLDRGTDRSGTVALTPGAATPTATMNIVEHGYTSDPTGPTRYGTHSHDGYDIVVGTTAETLTRPRFGFIDAGSSASQGRAKVFARAAIRQAGTLRRYFKTRVIAVTGAIPCVNFTVCDYVSGRDITATAEVQEVTAITWQQPGDGEAQSVQFTIESTEP